MSTGLKQFQEECLLSHNEYRLRHGASPLQWSQPLAWEAQCWAEHLAQLGELKHNDDDSVGENLAGMIGDDLSGKDATDMWYGEIQDYDFDRQGYGEDTSNFTQVKIFDDQSFKPRPSIIELLFGTAIVLLFGTAIILLFGTTIVLLLPVYSTFHITGLT